LLHINGFGATPLMELYLMYQLAQQHLQQHNINVVRSLVGNYTTSLDMAGCSVSITTLDQQLMQYWDAPVHTVSLKW
jgi:dihydroxyacetone kinase-like protein